MNRRIIQAAVIACALVLGMVTSAVALASAPQSFVVVLEPGSANVSVLAADLTRGVGGDLGFVYEHSIQGFSMTASPAAAAALARDPRVAYIETDREFAISEQTVPTGITRIFADPHPTIDIDGVDDVRVDVDVAVLDTGVDWQHPDLNVVGGINCASGSPFRAICSGNGDDDHYHGTHVAGTIAAIDNGLGVVGIAPGARLHAVKVLDSQGSGFTSWTIAGVDWVAARADTIEVANMSLAGSGYNQALYDAIQKAVNKGVAFAVAAGNSDADANNVSPAAFNNVLTVSALADFDGKPGALGSPTCRTDQDDTLADFSNWGSAIDINAPGVCILSTYPIERGDYGTLSGTSTASPHAAGALALLASKGYTRSGTGVNSLYTQVINAGNLNWTDDSGDGTKEPLLDVSNTNVFAPRLVAGSSGGGCDPAALAAPTCEPAPELPGDPVLSRIFGEDRFLTAVAISQDTFPVPEQDFGGVVFLANGLNFPDALAAGPAVAAQGGSLLLVGPTGGLPAATKNEITRVDPDEIVILGKTDNVSARAETDARALAPTVTRVAGSNRFDTSAQLSQFVVGLDDNDEPFITDTVIITSGMTFADALAGGTAGGWELAPLLLTHPSALHATVEKVLLERDPAVVRILGSTASVGAAVEARIGQLLPGAQIIRYDGRNRFETAAMLNADVFTEPGIEVTLTNGLRFPDALAGAARVNVTGGPMVPVATTCIPLASFDAIVDLEPVSITALGKADAVSDATLEGKPCPN